MFREYIYIPLGGSKAGQYKTIRNLAIVFLFTGIWHGAGWTFLIWGVWHGLFVILERLFLAKFLKSIPAIFSLVYTLFVVLIGWVFFRAPDLQTATNFIRQMFDLTNWSQWDIYMTRESLIFATIACLLAFPWWYRLIEFFSKAGFRWVNIYGYQIYQFMLLAILALSTMFMVGSTQNAFIYFQF